MPDTGYPAAALAGLLSFLSPCILPVVPFYLCYLTGLSMDQLRAGGNGARVMAAAALFALGVTTIFVLLGLGATTLGGLFLEWHGPLRWLAAAILLMLGLHMLGILRLRPLDRQIATAPPRPRSVFGAYAVGLAFGFGWTPCVGPSLTAILLVAAGSDAPRGAMLLLVYGLAMTLPFVAVAAFAGPAMDRIARHRRAFRHVERISGALLILFAVLIASDNVYLIANWMLERLDWTAILI